VGGGLCRRIAFGIAAECESVTTGYPWFKVMFSFLSIRAVERCYYSIAISSQQHYRCLNPTSAESSG